MRVLGKEQEARELTAGLRKRKKTRGEGAASREGEQRERQAAESGPARSEKKRQKQGISKSETYA